MSRPDPPPPATVLVTGSKLPDLSWGLDQLEPMTPEARWERAVEAAQRFYPWPRKISALRSALRHVMKAVKAAGAADGGIVAQAQCALVDELALRTRHVKLDGKLGKRPDGSKLWRAFLATEARRRFPDFSQREIDEEIALILRPNAHDDLEDFVDAIGRSRRKR